MSYEENNLHCYFACNNKFFLLYCSISQHATQICIYLAPFPRAPLDGTIPDIAVSSVGGRWLRTHVIWNGYCFAGAVCHLVDAGNVTCLYTNTARAHTRRKVAIVPPADADNDTFVRKDNVEIRPRVVHTSQHNYSFCQLHKYNKSQVYIVIYTHVSKIYIIRIF